jgi:hypothetical protein
MIVCARRKQSRRFERLNSQCNLTQNIWEGRGGTGAWRNRCSDGNLSHHSEKRKSQRKRDDPGGVEWICGSVRNLFDDWEHPTTYEKTTRTIGPGVPRLRPGRDREGWAWKLLDAPPKMTSVGTNRSGATDSCGTSTAHSLKELCLSRFKTFPLQALRKKFSTRDKNVAACCPGQARL